MLGAAELVDAAVNETGLSTTSAERPSARDSNV